LELHGAPLLATTLILPGESDPLADPEVIRERLERQIAGVVDAGACPLEPTTVVDLTGGAPELVRRGRGDPAALGL
ncbi:MAG: Sua5/YciO/YrdC/YwlC family protein, partial [Ottowia sp.]|nr:Sua5/YciO/YrdC/YwlC family protein [Ottowia sp.]